ncbi:DUF4214 domain-containing protein [Oxalobacteraceae bacterium]|nr:DUF4214 domain-containing protein [Oxalobacteraceae bacterium]
MNFVTGNNSIDALIATSWNDKPGVGVALTYNFMDTLYADASERDALGFSPMTLVQRSAARDAMAQWSNVANISFTEVASQGNLQLGSNDQTLNKSSGYARYPNESGISPLFINNAGAYNAVFPAGGFGREVLLHELGHTLGLKHPGDYDSLGTPTVGPYLPEETDSGYYTVMSYHTGGGGEVPVYGVTPMMYDIQAIQYLYGANTSYHKGDDVYLVTPWSAPVCVWDAGGSDTLDFSACTQEVTIDLNAGEFSVIGDEVFNMSIAFGVTIERAIAGSGGSTIFGNFSGGSSISGGVGADHIYMGSGNNTVDGGAGDDTASLYYDFADYAISSAGGVLFIDGDGHDEFRNVESFEFNDYIFSSTSLASLVSGTAGNDRLISNGNGFINAAAGIDTMVYDKPMASYAREDMDGYWHIKTVASTAVDMLFGVERLQFSDGAVALDIDGHAGQAYRLYKATFDRAPDLPGLGFWINHMDHGMTIEEVAGHFMNSDEFGRTYGSLSNEAFITQLYRNALHREPEAAGLAFHVNNLEHGMSRAIELVGFSESDENQAQVIGQISHGISYVPFVPLS